MFLFKNIKRKKLFTSYTYEEAEIWLLNIVSKCQKQCGRVSFYYFLLQNTEYLAWKQFTMFNMSFQSPHVSTAHHKLMAVTHTHISLSIKAFPSDVAQHLQSKDCLGYFKQIWQAAP